MLYLTLYCEKNEKNQKSPGLAHLNKTKGGDAQLLKQLFLTPEILSSDPVSYNFKKGFKISIFK